MKTGKFLAFIMLLMSAALLISACGSHKKGCDGRSKTRVDMGWM